mgnify:CR=1 FL=1
MGQPLGPVPVGFNAMQIPWFHPMKVRLGQALRRLHRDQAGGTTLEWALLVAAFVIPCIWLMKMSLDLLLMHYRMIAFLNSLPFL